MFYIYIYILFLNGVTWYSNSQSSLISFMHEYSILKFQHAESGPLINWPADFLKINRFSKVTFFYLQIFFRVNVYFFNQLCLEENILHNPKTVRNRLNSMSRVDCRPKLISTSRVFVQNKTRFFQKKSGWPGIFRACWIFLGESLFHRFNLMTCWKKFRV